ncbi:hypothetical protein ACFL6S_20025 [Candidatus Poribacteria bacterium]
MRYFSCLVPVIGRLMAASMLLWIAGCGDDDDYDECVDNVASVVTLSPNGGNIGDFTIITATFSKPVDTVTATGATLTVVPADTKKWTFCLPAGDGQVVTVEGTDFCGESVSASATFNVASHEHPVRIVSNRCIPVNGAVGVDPSTVDKIVIVFEDMMASVEVIAFTPRDAKIDPKLEGDALTISFLGGYKLSSEMEVIVELEGYDGAANPLRDTTYSFTTKAKE